MNGGRDQRDRDDWAEPAPNNFGALAAALAKAQSAFPAIPRDKQVTVTTKTGGSYTFKYAPLDSILAAVRTPLADNGLAIAQMLDGEELVTMLLHSGGGFLKGSVPIPRVDGGTVQALGSAITYLRRYSLQAVLGIAAEEDDDGNRASGNTVRGTAAGTAADASSSPNPAPNGERDDIEEMLGRVRRRGIIKKGSSNDYKLVPTPGPDGHVIGFRLEIDSVGDKNIPQCLLAGPIGEGVFVATGGHPETLIGKVAAVAGLLYNVKRPDKPGSWYRLHVDLMETEDWIIPAPSDEPSDAERAAIVAAELAEATA